MRALHQSHARTAKKVRATNHITISMARTTPVIVSTSILICLIVTYLSTVGLNALVDGPTKHRFGRDGYPSVNSEHSIALSPPMRELRSE